MKKNELIDLTGLTADSRGNEEAERLLFRLESRFANAPRKACPPEPLLLPLRSAQSRARFDVERIPDCSYFII